MAITTWNIITIAAKNESPESEASANALFALNIASVDIFLVSSICSLAVTAVNILTSQRKAAPGSTFFTNLKAYESAKSLNSLLISCRSSNGTLIEFIRGSSTSKNRPLKKVFDTLYQLELSNPAVDGFYTKPILQAFESYLQGIVALSQNLISFLSEPTNAPPTTGVIPPGIAQMSKASYERIVDQLTTFIC